MQRQSVRQSHPRAAAGAARCGGETARHRLHPARHQDPLRHRRHHRIDPGGRRHHRDRAVAVAGARGARARRALACHGAHARQCRDPGRGRNRAGRRRRVRRAVPRQHPQRAAVAALDGQAAALRPDSGSRHVSVESFETRRRVTGVGLVAVAGAGSGARGRRGSGKSSLSYSVRMPLWSKRASSTCR